MPANSLKDWEAQLVRQTADVELLGELAITEEECLRLGMLIGQLVRLYGPSQATDLLLRKYSCCLSVYLVAQGVYGFRGGDYWTAVCQVTGIPHQPYCQQWGQAFHDFLKTHRLPDFDRVVRSEKAHTFITRILAHGGIPNYCLLDFFNHVLSRAGLNDQSASDVIDDLRWSAMYLDKPARRFLLHGGKVAEDFLARCLEMSTAHQQTGVVPEAGELGLPPRIVVEYGKYVVEQPPGPDRQLRSLRRPDLILDPWTGNGLVLDLPAEHLSAEMANSEVVWLVAAGPASLAVPTRVVVEPDGAQTAAARVLIDRPEQVYTVMLRVDGKEFRTWRFQGPQPSRPVLAFNSSRNALLQWSDALPARPMWLLTPEGSTLVVEGEGQLLESGSRLPGDWGHYQVQHWDLTRARALTIRYGQDVTQIVFTADEGAHRPRLEGGLCLPLGDDATLPMYVGEPPHVRIPLATDRPIEEQLTRWRLLIRSESTGGWKEMPPLDAFHSAGKTSVVRDAVSGALIGVDIDPFRLLGSRPFGVFEVRARGPLGRDANLAFRIVPVLSLTGHDKVWWPDEGEAKPAVIILRTDAAIAVEPEKEDEGCRVVDKESAEDGMRQYYVHVPANADRAALVMTRQGAHLPLRLPLRRLRWGLLQGKLGVVAWGGRCLERDRNLLLDGAAPDLCVDLPMAEDQPALRLVLSLQSSDGNVLQHDIARTDGGRRRVYRFRLAQFADTVRRDRSGNLAFVLTIEGLVGEREPRRYAILKLKTGLAVENLGLEQSLVEREWALTLTWREDLPLAGRELRLWPLSRPWDPPFRRSIPNEAEGEFVLGTALDELPPGCYRLEMAVADPWAATVAERPTGGEPNTCNVQLGTREDYWRYLQSLPQDGRGWLQRALFEEDRTASQFALDHLTTHFEDCDSAALVDVLLGEGYGGELDNARPCAQAHVTASQTFAGHSTALKTLIHLLRLHPGVLLREIAAREGFGMARDAALRRLCLNIGLISSKHLASMEPDALTEGERERLWQLWPPLGLLADAPALEWGDVSALARARRCLGAQALGTIKVGEMDEENWSLNDMKLTGCFGWPLDSQTVEAPAKQLEAIIEVLGLVPKLLLDDDTWTTANATWLIRLRRNPRQMEAAARWVTQHRPEVLAALERIKAGPCRPAAESVRKRLADDPVQHLRDLPLVVGAVALLQRTMAHFPGVYPCRQTAGYWGRLGVEALNWASQLYTRDLCLVELTFLQERAKEDRGVK